ncbi:GspH/FimT family pseudopilin [Candidatus Venteria ishoeyi]|uniref:GspH/FimT family pseudopilin n=1 Tax=Candidatus Venteria ishoeyi TaxID=1899563 RepID=UPI0025A51BD8|nr:GspH/FimT family pseudopilin [Candidatus Venteria ishoeyi]MDM8547835.1 GspH/FimT family pseudopilin [Candidatus Venteria ishoeyi]
MISGFSLLELMVVLAIVSILVTTGLPQLSDFVKNSRLTTQTNNFVATLNMARTEAITRNQDVFVTAIPEKDSTLAGASNNEWSRGWTVWIDGRRDGGCTNPAKPRNKKNKAPNDDGSDFSYDGEDDSCEILKIFDYSAEGDNFPTIKMTDDDNNTLSIADASKAKAQITDDKNLSGRTLAFSGSDGRLSINKNFRFIEFYICDNRQGETGKHLQVNRFGRILLIDDADAKTQCTGS